jgi:hypothetical protein
LQTLIQYALHARQGGWCIVVQAGHEDTSLKPALIHSLMCLSRAQILWRASAFPYALPPPTHLCPQCLLIHHKPASQHQGQVSACVKWELYTHGIHGLKLSSLHCTPVQIIHSQHATASVCEHMCAPSQLHAHWPWNSILLWKHES